MVITMMRSSLTEQSENEIIKLVYKCKEGDNDSFVILTNRFYSLIVSIVTPFYAPGSETQDLIQEGLIGLFKAVKVYDPDISNSFFAIAKICIRRNVLQMVRSNNAKKQLIHHNSRYLFDTIFDDEMLITKQKSNDCNPLDEIIQKEFVDTLLNTIHNSFSDLEKNVLSLILEGFSYKEISIRINVSTKSVDNALFRIKKKIRKNFNYQLL